MAPQLSGGRQRTKSTKTRQVRHANIYIKRERERRERERGGRERGGRERGGRERGGRETVG